MSEHEMICTCKPEFLAEAEYLRLEVQQRLGVPAEKLAVAALLSLAWEFGAEVEVYADQWFGVEMRDEDRSDFVACDWPLDGICFMWKLCADRRFSGPMPDRPFFDNSDTRALSADQLKTAVAKRDAFEGLCTEMGCPHKISCGLHNYSAPFFSHFCRISLRNSRAFSNMTSISTKTG